MNPVFLGASPLSTPRPNFQYRAPLLSGEAGTAQTVSLMRKLIDQALSDPSFIRFAIDIVRNVQAYDELGEVQAVYQWVSSNIRYTKDPLTKEKLYPPTELLKIRAGDCDDISMLMGALDIALGYNARLVTISANPNYPEDFSHVYTEVEVPVGSGNWLSQDAARPGAQFGIEPPMYFRKRAWSLSDSSYQDLGRLGGYHALPRSLGDDSVDWGSLLQQTIQETPQIMAVATGQSTALKSANGTLSTGPFASFATPYTPGYGIPPAGYAAPGVSLTGSSSTLLLGLMALGLLLMVKR